MKTAKKGASKKAAAGPPESNVADPKKSVKAAKGKAPPSIARLGTAKALVADAVPGIGSAKAAKEPQPERKLSLGTATAKDVKETEGKVAPGADALDIDKLEPKLGDDWKKLKKDTETAIKESLKKLPGEYGCLAGCSKHLIGLIAETEFLDRVLVNLGREWAGITAPPPEVKEQPLKLHTSIWLEDGSVVTQPLDWFDQHQEVYISFPFYKISGALGKAEAKKTDNAKPDAKAGKGDAKAGKADAKAGKSDAKAGKTDAKANKMEAKGGKADAKVGKADAKAGKAGKADAKAGKADAKAEASKADAKASKADAKASKADAKASKADAKASKADAKASKADAKASRADAKASKAAGKKK